MRNFFIVYKTQVGAIIEIHLKKNWYFFPIVISKYYTGEKVLDLVLSQNWYFFPNIITVRKKYQVYAPDQGSAPMKY